MQNEIVKIDAEQFGVQKSEAKQIESAFVPMAQKMRELEDEYNKIVSQKEINQQVSNEARQLRLTYVKIRTNADKAHKEGKEKLLLATRAWDGLRNVLKHAASGKEDELMKIEKHQELLEQERKRKLTEKRAKLLEQYGADVSHIDLGEMPEDVFNNYLSGVKIDYDRRKEAERKAEEERKEKERLDKIEYERKLEIGPYTQFLQKERDLRNMEDDVYQRLISDLKKAKADHDKKQEEIRKENERLKKEREKQAEKERKEKEAYEAKLKKEREERKKIQREIEAQKEAERKKKEQEEAERMAREKAPDKEKLMNYINDMDMFDIPYPNTEEARKIADEIHEKFEGFKNWAINKINEL